jgi:hypothetical protein
MDAELIALIVTISTSIGGILKYFDSKKKSKRDEERWILEKEQLELENAVLKIDREEFETMKLEHVEKLNFYDDIIKLVIVNSIQDSVNQIFDQTTADRVLILTARNGKTLFRHADAIIDFYKNPEDRVDAVRIYTNVELDDPYVKLLKDTEYYGFVDLETNRMQVQILKHFYETENVNHSRIIPIARLPIDKNNDFLVYMSVAKHGGEPFTESEKSTFNLYNNNGIKPNIKKLLKTY